MCRGKRGLLSICYAEDILPCFTEVIAEDDSFQADSVLRFIFRVQVILGLVNIVLKGF